MAYRMINDVYQIPVIYHLVAKLKLIFYEKVARTLFSIRVSGKLNDNLQEHWNL